MERRLLAVIASLALIVYVHGDRDDWLVEKTSNNEQESAANQKNVYLNSWVVKITGGEKMADKVARRYDFDNLGLVEGFSDVYHFCLLAPDKVSSDVPYATRLALDNSVEFAEQQIREKRVSKSYVIPQDPLFESQWNLLNTGQFGEEYIGNDLRVEPAWLQGITGCNVTVAIVDDGLDYRHPDLWPNFAPAASYDVINNDTDPSSYFQNHGTQCSGVAASAQDDLTCGVGVAHRSNLGGLQLLSFFGSTDMEEATALSYARDVIDVYSNSWGPPDSGFHSRGPRTLTRQVLKEGVTEGRNGKGSIYVWANGNGGDYDDCGADGFATSIYTISVGAIGVDGHYSYFDERCSAKMVMAYVTNHYGYSNIITTSLGGECTEYFSGTSAATPMVAGGISLALEANPSLTWRDVQYLIVYTANPLLTNSTDTEINGAGLAVSHQYGFGVMDAEAMVTRAKHWVNVPSQMEDHVSNIERQSDRDGTYSATVTYAGQIKYLEHVVVQMSISIPDNEFNLIRGDLEINLLSPSGTLSVLLQPRPFDSFDEGYVDWPFMSVMFWGEDPAGEWTLNIKTRNISGVANISSNIDFVFYGVSTVPEAVANIPAQCHSDCRRGCAREGSNYCDSCVNLRNAYTLECIDECPSGYSNRSGYCYNASQPLEECNSPLKSKEGTDFTPGYNFTCANTGITECCPYGLCAPVPSYFPGSCFCDAVCFEFGDCCSDISLIGCEEEDVPQTFPYIELGVTSGVETEIVDPEGSPSIIDMPFPFLYNLEPTITVSYDGLFLISENISSYDGYFRAVGVFFSVNNESLGSVSYEVHTDSNPTSADLLSYVDSIIHVHENNSFNGKWLLIATWKDVAEYFNSSNRNTFQGVMVTDFYKSYAVFTYRCGDMSFSLPGTIGYVNYEYDIDVTHGATHRPSSHDIACFNMPESEWVNIVYEISRSVDECETDNGGCEQICTDTFLAYNCSCEDGYSLNNDGLTCSDVNECVSPDNHDCEQTCVNTKGSYSCDCTNGYVLNADGHACDDINECSADHDCEVECENTQGSYICKCNAGYELDGDERSCIDVNECLRSDHGCEQSCTNTIGSYLCNCIVGYTLNADGRNCDDVDECSLSTDECERTCENTVGSYVCSCGEGHELNTDGRTCTDIDECLGSDHGCEDICVNAIGTYNCSCREGYELNDDGRTCRDIDECANSEDNKCEHNCFNTEGSYTCSCREGYVLNPDNLTCSVSCSGTFMSLFGSFKTPDWPDSYPSEDFMCVWEIMIDNLDASILIEFQEPYGIFGSAPCETDYVEVLRGVGSNTTSIGKNCGTQNPGRIVVEANRATVFFRGSTHSQMDRPGVSVVYRAIVEELPFISLDVEGVETENLLSADDGTSHSVEIDNGYPLGCVHAPQVYVGTNGYFSFGRRFTGFVPFLFSEGNTISLVAPFFTDIDISRGSGGVRYQIHNDLNVTRSKALGEQVDTVINTNKLTNFRSKWLLVASWEDVSPYGDYETKASFQGVLATDFERSFAIFIYKCESITFSNRATIGFVTKDGRYANHPASYTENPYSISCLNYPASQWTNIIYEIAAGDARCN